MNKHPVLYSAVILTLLFEIGLAVMVYNEIGSDRLSIHIARFSFLLVSALTLFGSWKKIGVFLLTAYHIFSGLMVFIYYDDVVFISKMIGIFHLIIGFVIYFYEWLEGFFVKE